MTSQSYFDFFDHRALLRDYPVADFADRFRGMSADELRALQDARFRRILRFAWDVPFYRRLWGTNGIEQGDIGGIEDLPKLPTYSKSDLMASVEEHPPFGDFHGLDTYAEDCRPPVTFHSTSGTTGNPQPLMWGPRSREIQNMLLARLYLLQGMTRADVVQSVYGFGLVNGGHYIREAIRHWVGALVLPTGTGTETRSVQQVRVMRDFGTTVLVGFGDYLLKLAEIAREDGIEPGEDIHVRLISGHLGGDLRRRLAEAWKVEHVFDWYGVGDTGAIAGEGPDRDGLHVLEDAHVVELLDPDTQETVQEGEIGDLVCTCLYKDDIFPVIRFQTHDLTRVVPGPNPLDLPFRRIAGHLGRSDSMVKLRGVTVFPDGIGAILAAQFGVAEFVCKVDEAAGRSEMVVLAEVPEPSSDLAARMAEVLEGRLGVRIPVEAVASGATAALTGLETRQKPRRLVVQGRSR